MELKGATAAVTGGASGLGAATARALAAAGAKVAVWDLQEDKGVELAKEIGGVFCKANVADEASVTGALDHTVSSLGTPRVLVNCAGIAIGEKTVGKNGAHKLDSFRKVIEVNLIGTFNCIRLTTERMVDLDPVNDDGERGVVISTASIRVPSVTSGSSSPWRITSRTRRSFRPRLPAGW